MAQKATKGQLLIVKGAALVFFTSVAPRPTHGMSMSFEQNPRTVDATTRTVIDRFNETFNRHDADALALLLTDDTVFEDTSPAPDGKRIEGKAAVVAFWREWFGRDPDARFEAEEIIVSGDRAVVRWVYRKIRNGHRGACVEWTSSPCATGKWPPSSRT
jgi:ketosteroid isomerase-like protein